MKGFFIGYWGKIYLYIGIENIIYLASFHALLKASLNMELKWKRVEDHISIF